MRKKLAAGGLAVLGVLAFGIGGTYAAFSSTVQGPPAVAQAGTLNLALSTGQNAAIQPIAFQNLIPGAEKSYFIQLANTGTVAGNASWKFDNVQELENGCVFPENTAGDASCGLGPNQGELGNQLAVTFSLMPGPGCAGAPQAVGGLPSFPSSFTQTHFQPLNKVVLAPGASRCVRANVVFLNLPNNNLTQGDSSSFGFRFQLSS